MASSLLLGPMKISPEIYQGLLADIRAVAAATGVDVATAPGGATGLQTMYTLLHTVSRNRSFTDTHHNFAVGIWPRLLPYDGRDYCFYYAGGCDDTHLATALRRIKAELSTAR